MTVRALCRFDFNCEVVCPARGHTIPKQELDWIRKINTEKHLCSIQDPLLLSHDLGRTVHGDSRKVLQRELGRACRIMYTADDPIRRLCEPYRSSVYDSRGGNPSRDRENAGRGRQDGGAGRGGGARGGPREVPRSASQLGPRGGIEDRQGRRGGPRDSRRKQHQQGPPRGPPGKPCPPGLAPHESVLDGHAVV